MAERKENRILFIYIVIFTVAIIYIIKLFSIQIISDKYTILSERNSSRTVVIFPPRGIIYDRNGEKLVSNEPAYDLMIVPRQVKNPDTADLCDIVGITIETFRERFKKISDYSKVKPSVFITQISKEVYGILQEKLYKFDGFYIQYRSVRSYTKPIAAQILGYVGEVSPYEIEKNPYYKIGDYIGKSGIEKAYEEDIRGIKGQELVLVDVHNRPVDKFANGEFDTPSIQGKDIICTINAALQELGEDIMRNKKGSIVAIEPSTGEILALISSPSYDPNMLIGRKRSENYKQLTSDPSKPMFNRATQAQYSPGSTFKPLMALVCMEMESVTPSMAFSCSGPGSTPIKCTHNHGSPVNMLNGIEQSCNPYFWQIYRVALEKGGSKSFKDNYNKWREYVMSFGYGTKFDNDIPNQVRGNVPSVAFYDKIYGPKGWKAITVRSNSIGQGEVLATPLQIANLMAIIANSGFYITPHIVRSGKYTEKIKTAVEEKYFPIVKEGLARVCDFGTGRHYPIEGVTMAGKTGTVQNSHGKDHSVFMAYAPRENPKIAIAVLVENAGFGATYALPIASLMVERYLKDSIQRKELYETIKEKTIQ